MMASIAILRTYVNFIGAVLSKRLYGRQYCQSACFRIGRVWDVLYGKGHLAKFAANLNVVGVFIGCRVCDHGYDCSFASNAAQR